MMHIVIKYYGLRWSIEEVHRQIKLDFNWESILLMKYWSLKNMNALLWVSASFLYDEVRKIIPRLVTKHKNRLVYRNEDNEKDKNMMYRITALISDIMKTIDLRRLIKSKPKKKTRPLDSYGQLYLCFGDV